MSNDNSAFPRRAGIPHPGLTKREYFAAKALQGLLADPSTIISKNVAQDAVKLADHLIQALSNEQQ
jgi:hypothetical protein